MGVHVVQNKIRLPLRQGRQSPSRVRDHDPIDAWNGVGFRLREWHVYPSLNRLERSDHNDRAEIQVEPKHMDVLVHLARHAGDVVSKEQLLASTWDQQYVAETVLTRAVAELRRALGDDAHQPRFIETIPRRGYRLIAAVEAPSPAPPSICITTWLLVAGTAGLGFVLGWNLLRSRR